MVQVAVSRPGFVAHEPQSCVPSGIWSYAPVCIPVWELYLLKNFQPGWTRLHDTNVVGHWQQLVPAWRYSRHGMQLPSR